MREVAVILGDGVGPELVKAMMRIVTATGAPLNMVPCEAGSDWYESHAGNSLIPDETWDVINSTQACFKGPTTTPGGPVPHAASRLPLGRKRTYLQTFVRYGRFRIPPVLLEMSTLCACAKRLRACTRAVKCSSRAICTSPYGKSRNRRVEEIAHFAFAEADKRSWKTVVAIHKSNILKQTDGAFLNAVREVKNEYSSIELWEYHVDNVAQQLVKNPQVFDKSILLSTNLFMDILSEECAALVGSIGNELLGEFRRRLCHV